MGQTRVGVYVDAANLARNGGFGVRYDVLREFACHGHAEPIRLNVYVSFDAERARHDTAYRDGQNGFYSLLRDLGYKVIQKNVKWYIDENGNRFGKANADLDMAVDALLQSENLDRVLLATGDGDFVRVVQALQNKGCRVETLAFENVSSDLRREADTYISGYLVPNLLPTQSAKGNGVWGEIGSRVRGICYNHTGKGYGFLRFIKVIKQGLWRIDSRQEESPYESVFFHDSQLPEGISPADLPSRQLVFEFDLLQGEGRSHGLQAQNMQMVSPKTVSQMRNSDLVTEGKKG
ncbi:MAG: NYN domain-containing protein [Fibrobacterota bacterium]